MKNENLMMKLPFEVTKDSDHVMSIKQKKWGRKYGKDKGNLIRVYLFNVEDAKRISAIEPKKIVNNEKISFKLLNDIWDFIK